MDLEDFFLPFECRLTFFVTFFELPKTSRHHPIKSIREIVRWTHRNGVAPVAFVPLGLDDQVFPADGPSAVEKENRVGTLPPSPSSEKKKNS